MPVNRILKLLNLRLIRVGRGEGRSHPKTPDIVHSRVLPSATYSPWLSDRDFRDCYQTIKGHTLVDIHRCYELWQIGNQLVNVEGDYLEVGVWRGGTGCLLAKTAEKTGKTVFLADTFAGVVKAGVNDTKYLGGEHADTSEGIVLDLAERLSLKNIKLLKGIFPEETSQEIEGRIALLHCDVDVYRSAQDVVNWAMPHLSSGSVIVFDDYGFSGCEGVTSWVNELRLSSKFFFLHNLNGHGVLVKR